MKKIYIITGAAGHLGNNIIRMLEKEDVEIRALVLPNDNIKSLEDTNAIIYYGDVTQKETLNQIFEHKNNNDLYVIHAAGIVSIASKYNSRVYKVNVEGTKNIVDIALQNKINKFIYVSSVHAIPETAGIIKETDKFDPSKVEGLYAKTKAEATAYVLSKVKVGLPACVVHPTGIIGPNDYGRGHLTQLIIDYLEGKLTACVKGGYDFVDVRDVADGIINAIKYGEVGQCYILSNQYITISNLLNELSKVSGKQKIKTILPLWLAKLTAPLAETYYKLLKQPPLYAKYSLYTLNSNANFSKEKAIKYLKYQNRDLDDTLKDTIKSLVKQKRLPKFTAKKH